MRKRPEAKIGGINMLHSLFYASKHSRSSSRFVQQPSLKTRRSKFSRQCYLLSGSRSNGPRVDLQNSSDSQSDLFMFTTIIFVNCYECWGHPSCCCLTMRLKTVYWATCLDVCAQPTIRLFDRASTHVGFFYILGATQLL